MLKQVSLTGKLVFRVHPAETLQLTAMADSRFAGLEWRKITERIRRIPLKPASLFQNPLSTLNCHLTLNHKTLISPHKFHPFR
jgi:hypothetical protein